MISLPARHVAGGENPLCELRYGKLFVHYLTKQLFSLTITIIQLHNKTKSIDSQVRLSSFVPLICMFRKITNSVKTY